MKNMIDVINEFISLRHMHLCEITKHFNSVCSCDWCAYIVDELIYNNLGIRLSRSCTKTRDILNQCPDFITVNKNNLKAGDIVLYDWDNSGDCDHIGIISKISNGVVYVLEGNIKSNDFTESIVDEIHYDNYRKNHTVACFRYIKAGTDDKMIFYTINSEITLTECDLEHGHKADKLLCQAMLYNYGYYSGLLDGIFGEKTINAIKRFQANHQIPITGVVDFKTWKNLIDLI